MEENQKNPLVTAIIPVYNGEEFVADAIRSVLGQTYEGVECLVVDDGSKDNTASVVRGFGESVRYIHKANGGVASARNRGAAEARGRYIAFLDADDVWLPHKLERQMSLLLKRTELGLTYSGVYIVDEKLRKTGEVAPPGGSVALRNTLLLELPVMMISMTAVLPIGAFNAVGGFNERLSTSADTDFACRVACKFPVEAIDEPLALYRQHGSQMHLNARAMEHDMLLIFEEMFKGQQLPGDVSKLRGRAYANLFMTMAATSFHSGSYGRFLSYLMKAASHHPARAFALLWQRIHRRRDMTVGYA
ncbi:MAG: glycosyltransferase [Acidobacteriota bacterium]|nr:glycosyltransferase [Acidobacteriota bacterium]